jgi:hypothetical protein
MNRDEQQLLALEIATPTVYREWQRRAGTSLAWRDYFLLLNTFAEAIRRAPLNLEACNEIEMEAHLNNEFALLSDILLFLFPDGVMSAKVYADGATIDLTSPAIIS